MFSTKILERKQQEKLNDELLQAIIDRKDPSIIQQIIEKGADVNCTFDDGMTALHCACSNGHKEAVLNLIANGGDLNRQSDNGFTPLHWASSHGHTETVLALISNGVDLNRQSKIGWTPLHYASSHGHNETVLALISNRADVNQKCLYGWTPLDIACQFDKTKIALDLINYSGVNCVSKDSCNSTLHLASIMGLSKIVSALIIKEADVNHENKYGETPIQDAVKENQKAVIYILFESGANVSCLNQVFIDKYNQIINPETKDLITKITQAKNIKKRDKAFEAKKVALAHEKPSFSPQASCSAFKKNCAVM